MKECEAFETDGRERFFKNRPRECDVLVTFKLQSISESELCCVCRIPWRMTSSSITHTLQIHLRVTRRHTLLSVPSGGCEVAWCHHAQVLKYIFLNSEYCIQWEPARFTQYCSVPLRVLAGWLWVCWASPCKWEISCQGWPTIGRYKSAEKLWSHFQSNANINLRWTKMHGFFCLILIPQMQY